MKKVTVTEVDRSNAKDPVFRLDDETGTQLTRRLTELQTLVRELGDRHPERILPTLPSVARMAAGYGHVPPAIVDEVVREGVQAFFDALYAHPVLCTSLALQHFLESGQSTTTSTTTNNTATTTTMMTGSTTMNSNSKANSMSNFFKTVAKSVGTKVKEVDPWYEQAKHDLTTHLAMVDRCTKLADRVGKSQRALAASYADLAVRLSDLSGVESNPHLANGFRKFGSSLEKCSNLYLTIGDTANLHMSESLSAQAKSTESAIKTFENRLTALADYDTACKNTLKKKQNVDKLKTAAGQIKHDKVEAAMAELEEAKQQEEKTKQFLGKISSVIQDEEVQVLTRRRTQNTDTLLKKYSIHAALLASKEREEWQVLSVEVDAISEDASSVSHSTSDKMAAEVI